MLTWVCHRQTGEVIVLLPWNLKTFTMHSPSLKDFGRVSGQTASFTGQVVHAWQVCIRHTKTEALATPSKS